MDFMEGYVTSADKKPAADGRMVPARKIQMSRDDKNKDVAEKIDMEKADMGDVIKDFQDSDAPQFKGKSKEKRRQMAIAAKLDAEDKMKKEALDLSMRNAGPMKNIFKQPEQKKPEQKDQKKEELSAKQKKIDKNNNGKIDGDDLRKLRGEEMTPAQKAARLQLIKKSAAKLNKKAETDAKRAMRSDPVLGRRKSDPADHDLVHKEEVTNEDQTSEWQQIQSMEKGGEKRLAYLNAVLAFQKKYGKDTLKTKKSIEALNRARIAEETEVTHIVKYHDAQGNHKNDSKPMTQDKARAHAAKGNAVDKVGGKYTVHKINEGGPGSGRISAQDVKQGIGIARDKRYAGGNMTGASKAMNKLKKGLSDHPRVKDELRKQNEEVQSEAEKHRQLANTHKEKMLDAKDEDHRDGMTSHRMAHDAHMAAAKAHDKAPDSHTATAAKIASQKAHAASKKANTMFESVGTMMEDNEMEKKEMMKTQLHFIKYAADEICEYIDMGGEIEEWYQNKVSKAFADFEGLHSYMEGTARKDGLKEELDSQESDVDYDRKPTFAEFISKLNK